MKIWIGALWATLGVIACVSSHDGETLASEEQEAIGMCGANADPVTGVMCQYSYYTDWQGDPPVSYVGSETYEENGLDYVKCTWTIACYMIGTPKSDTGTTCVNVLGTGCNETTSRGTLIKNRLLPAGTAANQVDAYCQSLAVGDFDRQTACVALNHTTEQYEDLCCVPRPAPNPNPAPM